MRRPLRVESKAKARRPALDDRKAWHGATSCNLRFIDKSYSAGIVPPRGLRIRLLQSRRAARRAVTHLRIELLAPHAAAEIVVAWRHEIASLVLCNHLSSGEHRAKMPLIALSHLHNFLHRSARRHRHDVPFGSIKKKYFESVERQALISGHRRPSARRLRMLKSCRK